MVKPVACVIGWPVKHSRSPVIHRYWLNEPHAKPESLGRQFHLRLRNDHHYLTLWWSPNGRAWTQHWIHSDVGGYQQNVGGGFLSLRPAIYAAGQGEVQVRNFQYRVLP